MSPVPVEVVWRNLDDQGKGFVPQPIRWRVEQVNGTLMLHRRLTTPTPTWRDDMELAA